MPAPRPGGGLKRPEGLAGLSRYRTAPAGHHVPSTPSPRSRGVQRRGGGHGGGGGGAGGFIGFGRELEVLALLCIVACVPLLSSRGLSSSRLAAREASTQHARAAAAAGGGGLHDVNNQNKHKNNADANPNANANTNARRGWGTGVGYAAASSGGSAGGASAYAYGGSLGRKGGAAPSLGAQLEGMRAFEAASEIATSRHTSPAATVTATAAAAATAAANVGLGVGAETAGGVRGVGRAGLTE